MGFQTQGEVKVYGTMAHSFILSYTDKSDLGALRKVKGVDILDRAIHYRNELNVLYNILIEKIVDTH